MARAIDQIRETSVDDIFGEDESEEGVAGRCPTGVEEGAPAVAAAPAHQPIEPDSTEIAAAPVVPPTPPSGATRLQSRIGATPGKRQARRARSSREARERHSRRDGAVLAVLVVLLCGGALSVIAVGGRDHASAPVAARTRAASGAPHARPKVHLHPSQRRERHHHHHRVSVPRTAITAPLPQSRVTPSVLAVPVDQAATGDTGRDFDWQR